MALEDIVSTLFGSNIYNTAPPTGSVMYDYFLPFIIIWTVSFGILEMLNIFKGKMKVNLVLSIAMTLMMTATPYWFTVSHFISTFGSYTVVIVFIIVFVFGVIAWGLGKGADYTYRAGESGVNPIGGYLNKGQIDRILEEIRKLEYKQSLYDSSTPQYKALEDQIEIRRMRLKELGMSRRDLNKI